MQTLAQVFRTWEDVLEVLRRTSVSWQGHPLSDRDRDTYTEAIVLCALHLTDMSSRHGGIGSPRDIIAWAYTTATLDVHVLGSFLSDCIKVLRHVSEPCTYNWFKRQLSQDYPFVGQFCAPIKKALTDFLGNPNPRDFRVSLQFFSFLTHLSLLDLAIDLEDEYEDLEDYLHSLSYPDSILVEMNSIMKEWMKTFSVTEENFLPSHGSGATAEVSAMAGIIGKYQHLGVDALIDYVFSHHVGIDITSYFPYPAKGINRMSELVFVPKSMKTRRAISKEPTSLMYLQQGIQRVLYSYIHGHYFLSSHIDLRDQSVNAGLAISSSRDQKFATIDLSSASDTVTVELVKAVFRGTPLYPFLVALRSNTVKLPSGKIVRVAKFAPMGSALCFPVETLIFACAVELAVRRAQRTHLGNFPKWRVYGDDIIVANDLYEDVVLVLESLGFILNDSKSFRSPARYRESCGGEGYDGVDVTPLKISRRFISVRGRITSRHASVVMGLIDFANNAEVFQFPLVRAWIIRVILGNPIAPPLFSRTGHGALYSINPDNFRAAKRLNWDRAIRLDSRSSYQRLELQVLVGGLKTKKTFCDPYTEQARYFETLRLSSLRTLGDMFQPEHRISVPRGSSRLVLRKTWVPLPR